MNITAKSVAGLDLAAGETDKIFFDTDLKGFGIRLRRGADGGVKHSWIVQYRHGRASRRLLIGNTPPVSAGEARKAAEKLLAKVALGEDPSAAKHERRTKDGRSFRTVVAEYLETKKSTVRPKTFRDVERYLTKSYFKPLHSMPVDAVKRLDIALCLNRINRDCGGPTAARARTTLSAFFGWTMTQGVLDANPVIGTAKPQDSKPRKRVLVTDDEDYEELIKIWKACGDYHFGKIVKLLILTGARRTEVGGMLWSELNPEKGTWIIPENTRTKNGCELKLTLPPMAWDIINSVPRRGDYLFGVRAGFGHWAAKAELDSRLKGVEKWTLHDLRRTVATGMGNIGVQPHIIEQVLNHVSGHKKGVAGTYNRSPYTAEVKAALALWADHVHALVEGGERKVLAYKPSMAS